MGSANGPLLSALPLASSTIGQGIVFTTLFSIPYYWAATQLNMPAPSFWAVIGGFTAGALLSIAVERDEKARAKQVAKEAAAAVLPGGNSETDSETESHN